MMAPASPASFTPNCSFQVLGSQFPHHLRGGVGGRPHRRQRVFEPPPGVEDAQFVAGGPVDAEAALLHLDQHRTRTDFVAQDFGHCVLPSGRAASAPSNQLRRAAAGGAPAWRATTLPLGDDQQRGNGLDVEAPGQRRRRVDVDLDELDLAGAFLRQFVQHGADHAARAAPGSPEVHRGRDRGLSPPPRRSRRRRPRRSTAGPGGTCRSADARQPRPGCGWSRRNAGI